MRKILAKKRLKKLLHDELHQVEFSEWETKIGDDAVSFFAEKCETFFPVATEQDLLKVARKVIPIMYRNAQMFARHRIVSDDVEVAFILATNRPVSIKEP